MFGPPPLPTLWILSVVLFGTLSGSLPDFQALSFWTLKVIVFWLQGFLDGVGGENKSV